MQASGKMENYLRKVWIILIEKLFELRYLDDLISWRPLFVMFKNDKE